MGWVPRFAVLLLVLGAARSLASERTPPSFEEELGGILGAGEGRALAGVVVRGTEILWLDGIGTADVARGTKATADTIFQLASAGKILTGLALCDLAVTGKLSLDDEVAVLAPELPIDYQFSGRPLRIRHLLEHTSGIHEILPRWYDERRDAVLPVLGLIQKTLDRVPVRWPPGERNIYSNFNYVAAAHLIEKRTGMAFDEYIARRFFRPLGMASASYRLHADARPEVARGYAAGSSKPLSNTLGVHRVAAGMAASAADLGKLLVFFLQQGRHQGEQIVPREAFALMERIETGPAGRHGLAFGHGAGAVARRMRGFRFFGHNGIVDGFTATLFYSREANLGFAFLSNAHPLPRAPSLSRLRDAALDRFLPGPGSTPRLPATADPDAFVGFYQVAGSRFASLAGFDRLLNSEWIDAAEARSLTDAVLAHDEQGRAFLFRPPTTYLERVSPLSHWARIAGFGLAGLAALATPVHLVMAVRRRERGVPALLLGLFMAGAFAVALALSLTRTSEDALRFNAMTGSLYGGSLLMYASAWGALLACVLRLARHRTAAEWSMFATAAGASALMQAFAFWGLVGIKMWDGGKSVLPMGY